MSLVFVCFFPFFLFSQTIYVFLLEVVLWWWWWLHAIHLFAVCGYFYVSLCWCRLFGSNWNSSTFLRTDRHTHTHSQTYTHTHWLLCFFTSSWSLLFAFSSLGFFFVSNSRQEAIFCSVNFDFQLVSYEL